jgi:hypothetical protein
VPKREASKIELSYFFGMVNVDNGFLARSSK